MTPSDLRDVMQMAKMHEKRNDERPNGVRVQRPPFWISRIQIARA
jgi:hypothetical protein